MLIYTVTNEPHTGLSWQGLPKIPAQPPGHSWDTPKRCQNRPKSLGNAVGEQGFGGQRCQSPDSPPMSLVPSLESHVATWHCQFQRGKQMDPAGVAPELSPRLSPKISGRSSLRVVPSVAFLGIWGQLSPRIGSGIVPPSGFRNP